MCLSVEMQGLLGLAVYIVCSTAPDPIPVVALCGLERENREIPTDAWCTDDLTGAISPPGLQLLFSPTLTPTGWKQAHCDSQLAQLRVVQLVIPQEPWLYPFALTVGHSIEFNHMV